jgi:hypothetical protein
MIGHGIRRRFVAATFFLLGLYLSAPAETDARLEYKRRNNRFEGQKGLEVRAPDLDLLSFVAYQAAPERGSSLKLLFYLDRNRQAFITARELMVRKYYFMEPVRRDWNAGWQEFGPWPTAEVLDRLNLPLRDIGVVCRLDNEGTGSGSVAPVWVYAEPPPRQALPYTLYFRPREDLSEVEYKVVGPEQQRPAADGQLRDLAGGVPFSIRLDLSHQPEGLYTLSLLARYSDRPSGPKRSYTFFHTRGPR